jgi:hypothetical protein
MSIPNCASKADHLGEPCAEFALTVKGIFKSTPSILQKDHSMSGQSAMPLDYPTWLHYLDLCAIRAFVIFKPAAAFVIPASNVACPAMRNRFASMRPGKVPSPQERSDPQNHEWSQDSVLL